MGSCSTLNDLSNRIYLLSKTEDLNLNAFNMITVINKSKALTKHISIQCQYNYDSRKCSWNQKKSKNKCCCECKNPIEHDACERNYIWSPATCTCKNSKYSGSIIEDSVIKYDEILSTAKNVSTNVTVSTNFHNKNVRYKMDCYILHTVLLVIILLFISAIIQNAYAKRRSKKSCIAAITK